MRNLFLELLESFLVLEIFLSFQVVLLTQGLIFDGLNQFFFQNLGHGMDLHSAHESVIGRRLHDQMFVLFEEVVRLPDILFHNAVFVFDQHQLHDQRRQSAFLVDDFLNLLLAQTLELSRIVLFQYFFEEELFDLWEQAEFGFSLFEFVEDGFAETLSLSAGRLVFEEENEDVVDVLTVVEETVQENLIVMAVTVEVVPLGRLLSRYLVEEQLFDGDLLEMVQ